MASLCQWKLFYVPPWHLFGKPTVASSGLRPPLMGKLHVCTAREYCLLQLHSLGLICYLYIIPTFSWRVSISDTSPPYSLCLLSQVLWFLSLWLGWLDCSHFYPLWVPHSDTVTTVCWYTSVQSLFSLHMSCNYFTTAIKVTCETLGGLQTLLNVFHKNTYTVYGLA